MALDTDHTSATYDSFFTVVEMDGFIQQVKFNHGGDARWLQQSEDDKEILILNAVAYINSHEWEGVQNIDIIVLTMDWPRDPYGDSTPNDIGLAMACNILRTLNIGGIDGAAASGDIKKKKVGPVEVEYDVGGSLSVGVTSKTCAEIYAHYYLIPLVKSGGIGGVGLNRLP